MRALLCSVLVAAAACAPKVSTTPSRFDEELPSQAAAQSAPAPEAVVERKEAPPGKGLRAGTIDRAKLIAVLDHGPAAFLGQLEVTAKKDGDRFVGWQLVQVIDHTGPLVDVDVVPGDVLLSINGKPLSRPDQLQTVWESLRTSDKLTADIWRGKDSLRLAFTIEPAVAAANPAK